MGGDPLNQFLNWLLGVITTAINPIAAIAIVVAICTYFVSGLRAASRIAGVTVAIWGAFHYDSILAALGRH